MEKVENINDSQKFEEFETKLEKSKKLLEKLLDPEITLSSSVEVYENGLKELKEAQDMLNCAKLQFEELQK